MWLLSCPSEGGHSYRLTKEKEHYVSRSVGDIILTGDQSVSRKHAVLKVISNSGGGDSSGVTVTDLGSKYGTYINESTKLDANKPYLLKNGDIIKFGCQWNEWRFNSKPLVVATSTLPPEVKISLKNLIHELGGTLINDWQETCSHLTMTSILLTAKVVCALASAVPIVTPEYWTHFKEAVEEKKLPPEPDKFIPPLKENILNKNKVSFAVNEERRTIFAGKTFVFCTERQMKKYRTLISAAGGKCVALCDCKWKIEDFCRPDIILMQNISGDESQHSQSMDQYNSVSNLLKSKGSRPIPESELGLAILMCSLNIYCNPQYNVVSNVLMGGNEVSLSQLKTQEVWAADTPSMIGESSVKIEKTFEEMSTVKKEMTDGETGSSSFHDSEDNSDKMDERETLPMEEFLQNRSSKPGQSNQEVEAESENTSSRKRMATDDSENPPSKRMLSEISPLEELLSSSNVDAFDFTDLCTPGSSRRSAADNQKKSESNVANSSESAKQKHIDSENAFTNSSESAKRKHVDSGKINTDDQRKKSRLEEACSSKQSNPYCSKDLAITIKSEKNATGEGKIANSDRETSKTVESCISKEVFAGKSSFDKETKESDRDLNKKLNGVSSVMKPDALATPSTSKAGSSKEYINASKADKKKVEDRKWNRGMTGGILDMVVKMENLIVERPSPQLDEFSVNQHSVNFKKFKKVRSSAYKNALPEIIGESDLIAS